MLLPILPSDIDTNWNTWEKFTIEGDIWYTLLPSWIASDDDEKKDDFITIHYRFACLTFFSGINRSCIFRRTLYYYKKMFQKDSQKHDDLAHHLIALNIYIPFFPYEFHILCSEHTWKGNKTHINGEKWGILIMAHTSLSIPRQKFTLKRFIEKNLIKSHLIWYKKRVDYHSHTKVFNICPRNSSQIYRNQNKGYINLFKWFFDVTGLILWTIHSRKMCRHTSLTVITFE